MPREPARIHQGGECDQCGEITLVAVWPTYADDPYCAAALCIDCLKATVSAALLWRELR